MKKLNRWLAVCGCALLGVGSAMAEGEALGVLTEFNAAEAGTAITTIILSVLAIIASVYGAGLGIVVIKWVYRQIKGALTRVG